MFAHNPDRPWVIQDSEHRPVALDDDVVFSEWARNAYPQRRFTVQLDAWGDSPTRDRR